MRRLSDKVPDFASPQRELTLEYKRTDIRPDAKFANNLGRNASNATWQSRRLALDYRGTPSVTEQHVLDALPAVIARADVGPYADEIYVITVDGGIHWKRA